MHFCTVFESAPSDSCDPIPSAGCGDGGAVLEHIVPHAGNAVGDHSPPTIVVDSHFHQPGAALERRVTDACDLVADCDFVQFLEIVEHPRLNFGDAVAQLDSCQSAAPKEQARLQIDNAVGYRYGRQLAVATPPRAVAPSECRSCNGYHWSTIKGTWDHRTGMDSSKPCDGNATLIAA